MKPVTVDLTAIRERRLSREWSLLPLARREPRIYKPLSKQEIPEYVDPFDVQADWDERA